MTSTQPAQLEEERRSDLALKTFQEVLTIKITAVMYTYLWQSRIMEVRSSDVCRTLPTNPHIVLTKTPLENLSAALFGKPPPSK